MFNKLIKFLLLFVAVFLVLYCIHTWSISHFSWQSNAMILKLSYIFNGIYTIVLTALIIIFHKKYVDHIGLIFLAGSFLKIAIFVGIIKLSGMELNRSLFLDFFIPYSISLIMEVSYVGKLLNSMHSTNVD